MPEDSYPTNSNNYDGYSDSNSNNHHVNTNYNKPNPFAKTYATNEVKIDYSKSETHDYTSSSSERYNSETPKVDFDATKDYLPKGTEFRIAIIAADTGNIDDRDTAESKIKEVIKAPMKTEKSIPIGTVTITST